MHIQKYAGLDSAKLIKTSPLAKDGLGQGQEVLAKKNEKRKRREPWNPEERKNRDAKKK